IDLPQLRDDLFRLVLLLRHALVLQWLKNHTSGRTTSVGADHFVHLKDANRLAFEIACRQPIHAASCRPCTKAKPFGQR
ncbi:hypothetical protein, partial [Aurantimonas sp. DM33-3]|uniref:hypothetical protein n=1 Tax=Aurantimonas sp. DM33-3 TaxID=2766955 RepID=UPI001AEDE857